MKNRIYFGRIIMYIALGLVVFFFHDFLHSHFYLLLLLIMVILPLPDILLCLYVRHSLSCSLLTSEPRAEKYTLSYVTVKLRNKAFFPSLSVRVNLTVENKFYNEKSSIVLTLPARIRKTEELQLPIKLSRCGLVEYSVDSISVLDILGFVEFKKKNDSKVEMSVLPYGNTYINRDLTDMNRGLTEAEETNKRGNDFSDVNDVREYIPGDKLMSIHWKLSAKRDILMVKDRVSMSDQQMVVLMELSGTPEELEEVVALTYGMMRNMITSNLFIRFMWWSESRYIFEERQLMNRDNLSDAFNDVFYEKRYPDPEKTREYMRSIRPELKAYIDVLPRNGEAVCEVVEQD